MIDPLVEDLITPAEATSLYPRGRCGKKVHVSKVYRDLAVGVSGVRLESIRTPRLATSRQAVARFFRHLSEPANSIDRGTVGTSMRKRDMLVERELDGLGF